MKKKLFLMILMVAVLACLFAVSISAASFDKSETVTVTLTGGGTQECALYDADGNALVWYSLDGGATLISVKASDLVYSSTTELKDISLSDGTPLQKVSETSTNTIVVANLRELTFEISPQYSYKTTFMNSKIVQYIYMPSTLKKIYCNAVSGCTNLKIYDIPSDAEVDFIDVNSFNSCSSLLEINLGSHLTSIGASCFYNCTSLAKVYVDPNSPLKSIGGGAFDGCSITQFGLVPNEARVPDSVISMGNNVFKKSKFNVLYLPKSLTTLGYNVADGNTNLTDVYMPEVLTSWDVASFLSCTALKNIYGLAELFENGYLSKIPGNTFSGCTSLEYVFENNAFPTGLETIGYNAFRDCTSLKTPTFPNTLKVTESFAFYNCSSFGPTIVFPNSLETFGQTSLCRCSGIKTVYMGANVTAFGGYDAFNTMSNLTTIYMPSGISVVPINTFHNSSNLTTVYFTGTEAQLSALYASATQTGGNTNFTRLTPISYADYMALEDKSGRYAVYNYNACDAFYNGIHEELLAEGEVDTNLCVLTKCAHCDWANKYVGDDSTHIFNYTYAYANGYMSVGTTTCACANTGCIYNGEGNEIVEENLAALFIFLGYSSNEAETEFAVGFRVDNDAVAFFEEKAGVTLTYGVIGVLTDNLTEGDTPFDAQAAGAPVIEAVVPETVSTFYLRIRGFSADYLNLGVTMGAYVSTTEDENTETVFLQEEQGANLGSYTLGEYLGTTPEQEENI